ncbi:MAG: DedA family protein [Chloroflexota bacterium]|nr:DedA family protein [Chloroflexota bacterium]
MENLFGQLVGFVIEIIATLGYIGVGLLVALESIFPPIPSEVILPLSGSLVSQGRFNLVPVMIAATLGAYVGAVALYGIGKAMGKDRLGSWLDKYGKWLLLSKNDLERAQAWFDRHGTWAVLLARLVPGVRSLISVPAGISEMPFWRFSIFTIVGSAIWNGVLVGAGMALGANWQQVEQLLKPLSPFIYGLLALVLIAFVARRLWARRGKGKDPKAEANDSHSSSYESPWLSR